MFRSPPSSQGHHRNPWAWVRQKSELQSSRYAQPHLPPLALNSYKWLLLVSCLLCAKHSKDSVCLYLHGSAQQAGAKADTSVGVFSVISVPTVLTSEASDSTEAVPLNCSALFKSHVGGGLRSGQKMVLPVRNPAGVNPAAHLSTQGTSSYTIHTCTCTPTPWNVALLPNALAC